MRPIIKLAVDFIPNGPSNTVYTVGKDGVTKIEEHCAAGEGDKWYYDVYFEDGTMRREFYPQSVEFGEDIPYYMWKNYGS